MDVALKIEIIKINTIELPLILVEHEYFKYK